MARGNWERRIEKTVARRAAAKQRKNKKDNRTGNKLMVQEFFKFLEKPTIAYNNSTTNALELHVWIDTIPPDIVDESDDESEDEHRRRGKKKKSGGHNNNNNNNNNNNGEPQQYCKNNKGKSHPRSRAASMDKNDVVTENNTKENNNNIFLPRLYQDQFYDGGGKKCIKKQNNNRKGNNTNNNTKGRHNNNNVHFDNNLHNQRSLGDILGEKKQTVLNVAHSAMLEDQKKRKHTTDEDGGDMDMLYYFNLNLFDSSKQDDNNKKKELLLPSKLLSHALSNKSCANASLVYVSVNDLLLFDRFQGGLLQQQPQVLHSTNNIFPLSDSSVVLSGDSIMPALDLPSSILEFILSFLPDEAVSVMIQVCKKWKMGIGTTSPYLWRTLLERQQWPIPPGDGVDFVSDTTTTEVMKGAFLMHYKVIRNVRAIQLGLNSLLKIKHSHRNNNNNNDTSSRLGKEVVLQDFSTRRQVPTYPNVCVSTQVWSSDKILFAYSDDCSIRLFQVIAPQAAAAAIVSSNNNSPGKKSPSSSCRELIRICVDPYRKTKKQSSHLLSMALDEDVIVSLLHVRELVGSGNPNNQKEHYILSILPRDDYLVADVDSLGWSKYEEDAMTFIDLAEAVVNYLTNNTSINTEDDPQLNRLVHFLSSDNGNIWDVQVLASHTVVECGHGKFLVEVTISIPDENYINYYDNTIDASMVMLGRKLVVFSSTAGAIVWLGDSNPAQGFVPRDHDLSLSSIIQQQHCYGGDGEVLKKGPRQQQHYSFAAVSSVTPSILLGEVDFFWSST